MNCCDHKSHKNKQKRNHDHVNYEHDKAGKNHSSLILVFIGAAILIPLFMMLDKVLY